MDNSKESNKLKELKTLKNNILEKNNEDRNRVLLEVKNKYSYIRDNLYEHLEVAILFMILPAYVYISTHNSVLTLLSFILYIFLVIFKHKTLKYIIENRTLKIFKDRVEYHKTLPFNRTKKILFRDIDEIRVSTRFLKTTQTLYFIPKNTNFMMKNSIIVPGVENIEIVLENITKIYDEYIKTHKI